MNLECLRVLVFMLSSFLSKKEFVIIGKRSRNFFWGVRNFFGVSGIFFGVSGIFFGVSGIFLGIQNLWGVRNLLSSSSSSEFLRLCRHVTSSSLAKMPEKSEPESAIPHYCG